MPETLVLLKSSLILDKRAAEDSHVDLYAMIYREIKQMLIEHGRTDEKISWVRGDYIFGKEWPLGIEWGPDAGDHYRVLAYCTVPKSHLSPEMLAQYEKDLKKDWCP